MRRRKTCLRTAFLCLKRLTNGLKYAILLGYRILGCRQAVRQRTLTPSPRGFESRQPSQKKGLCVLQSPFFNRINPFWICETALWAVKCLRTFIKRKTADCGISESRRLYKERKWVTLIFWHRSGGFRPRGGRLRASSSWRRDHTLCRAVFFNLFEISITTHLLFLNLPTIYCLFCRTAIIKTGFVMKNLSKVGFCKNRKRRKGGHKNTFVRFGRKYRENKSAGLP